MKRRQVLMSDSLWQSVNAIAERQGSNASAVVRKAVIDLVQKESPADAVIISLEGDDT